MVTERPSLGLPLAEFIHIPGPNPILKPGSGGEWDSGVTEAAHMLKDHDTYHFYYHATGPETGYQLGVATAPHPLGPWTKYEANPVLPVGPPGSWDSTHAACAFVVKEGTDRFTMVYSGRGGSDPGWHIGLAASNSPLGPWEKHEGNPVLRDFGYVGGVIPYKGRYHLYTEHPIGSTGQDYGPVSLAIADSLEGPWAVHEEGPVVLQGEWGDWDDGGMSEAGLFLRGGVFHMFYGGAKVHPERRYSRESIGYAYSHDGVHFEKHPRNPVAPRENHPNAAAFAEVHSYYEPPFVYCYHTLRYNTGDWVEDLGVEVLATSRPFSLAMPVLHVDELAPCASTEISDCPAIPLGPVDRCALTVEYTCAAGADLGLVAHVRASADGVVYDTLDWGAFEVPARPGETVRQTFPIAAGPRFVKVTVRNGSQAVAARDVVVTASLSG